MVSFNFRIAFLAVTLAGNVAATHIKKHRFFSHRSQCRPRLESTIQTMLPLAVYPSAPERSSSVSIHAQTSCHSDSESTTTTAIVSTTATAIVKRTSTAQLTSATKVVPSLSTSLTPNGFKAGIAGGDAYPYMKDHIGWWYDWSVDVPFFPLA
jgi:hypothetical protein